MSFSFFQLLADYFMFIFIYVFFKIFLFFIVCFVRRPHPPSAIRHPPSAVRRPPSAVRIRRPHPHFTESLKKWTLTTKNCFSCHLLSDVAKSPSISSWQEHIFSILRHVWESFIPPDKLSIANKTKIVYFRKFWFCRNRREQNLKQTIDKNHTKKT